MKLTSYLTDYIAALGPQTYLDDGQCQPCYQWSIVSFVNYIEQSIHVFDIHVVACYKVSYIKSRLWSDMFNVMIGNVSYSIRQ